jgi:hypothetical protein
MPEYDDFVSKIVRDPKKPPDTILLVGFLGKSSERGHTRLYFDPALSTYVEIPDSGIVYKVPIPKEQSFLGGFFVWLKVDAQLIHGRVGSTRLKASFLEGPIRQHYAGVSPLMHHGHPCCYPQPTAPATTTAGITSVPVFCMFTRSILPIYCS